LASKPKKRDAPSLLFPGGSPSRKREKVFVKPSIGGEGGGCPQRKRREKEKLPVTSAKERGGNFDLREEKSSLSQREEEKRNETPPC